MLIDVPEGSQVGEWRVDALLDDGPTTLTYRVQGPVGDSIQPAVLRLLKIRDDQFAERLRRNAQALADARDHLVPVHGVVEHEGLTGVVSAWIDGPDLGAWAKGSHPLAHRLALFEDLVAGLDEAHRAGLVHRNIKPSKVRVDLGGGSEPTRAFLEDFLLSRVVVEQDQALTGIGVTFGTPQYMSPEQFHGAADVGPRGDLFSAGCVLYELVAGRRAFDGTSIRDVYMAIIEGRYAPLDDVPEPVASLVADLLQPATEDRPDSAAAVLARLRTEPLSSLVERPEPGGATDLPATRRKPSAPKAFPTLMVAEEDLRAAADDDSDEPAPELSAPSATASPLKQPMMWLLAAGLFVGGAIVAATLVLAAASLWAGSS